jgi:hypothetical protein
MQCSDTLSIHGAQLCEADKTALSELLEIKSLLRARAKDSTM